MKTQICSVKYRFAVIIMFLLLLTPMQSSAQNYNFEFKDTHGDIRSLSEFQGKPIVLDWAASWCPTCKDNQRTMRALRLDDQYKTNVTFLSISFGGSGDELSDVDDMKGSDEWTFGLDINNVAADYDVANGYMWILDEDLNLIREWEYQVVPKSQLENTLNTLLGIDSDNQNTDSNEDDFNTFGLGSNPLFVGFIAVTALSIFYLGIKSIGNSGDTITKEEEMKEHMEKQKENWDWNQ